MKKDSKRKPIPEILFPILEIFSPIMYHWHTSAWETVVSLVYSAIMGASIKETQLACHMPVGTDFWAKDKRVKRFLKTFKFEERQFWGDFNSFIYNRHHRNCKKICIALDWTFEGNWCVLVAVQVIEGRGIPVAVRAYPIDKDRREEDWASLEKELIKEVRDSLSLKITIIWLMDRGYGNERILSYLQNARQTQYVVRIKKGTYAKHKGSMSSTPLYEWIGLCKSRTLWKNILLNLSCTVKTNIVFVPRIEINGKLTDEPWYLATNMVDAELVQLLYAARWSVECQFKDVKQDLNFKHPKWGDIRSIERLYVLLALVLEWSTSVGIVHHKEIPTRKPRDCEKYQRIAYCRGHILLVSYFRHGCVKIRIMGTSVLYNPPGEDYCASPEKYISSMLN